MATPTPLPPPTDAEMAVGHMAPEQFRRLGHELVDRIAAYLATVESRPVRAGVSPGETIAKLPASAPERPEGWDGPGGILADIDRIVMPGLTHWQHPGFFGFFPANTSGPAILGDLLCAGLGVQGMLWATSPACTEVETRVCDWLAEMLGLPETFRSTSGSGGGVIQSTASEATLVALVAARHRVLGSHPSPETRTPRPDLTVYTSTQAHSSVVKAAMIAGLARDPDDRTHLRLIGTTDDYAMDPAQLARAMDEDARAGRRPCLVVATVGTTSSTAIDPLMAIGPIVRRHGAWLHVDAAYSGAACVCPEFREAHLGRGGAGVAFADSFAVNPHKWLLTNFDCNVTWTADRAAWTGALSVTPEYLRNADSASGRVIDYRDWQVPLGRRFRALKLWFVIRHYGVEGLRAYIRGHIALAARFEALVRADERFEVVTPRTSGLVCFRLRPRAGEGAGETDARNRRLLERVNDSGQAYLTHTVLPPTPGCSVARLVLRVALGAPSVRAEHIDRVWGLLAEGVG